MAELSYAIEKQKSQREDFLVIRLSQEPLNLSRWRQLAASQQDKDVLSLLLKEEIAYQLRLNGRSPHAETMQLSLIHISPLQAIPILEQLAYTQKLFFNEKQLVADFYGKVEFYYEGNLGDDGSLNITGRLRWRDKDIPLSDCLCIGPGKPLWFIHGISLKIISTAITWKELHSLYYNKNFILTGPQKQAFIEELDPDDPEIPKLIIKSGQNLEDLQQNIQPYPLLILKDRSGAFADLWMDYGSGHKVLINDFKSTFKAGETLLKRQLEAEKNWEKDLLESDFIRKQTGTSYYYCPTDKVGKSLTFLLEIGWSIQDWKGNRVVKQDSTQIYLDENHGAILVKGKIKFENFEADVANVIGAFNRRERFVQIAPDAVGLFSLERDFAYLQEIAVEGELVGETIRVKKNNLGSLSGLFEKADLAPSLQNFKDKLLNFTGIEEVLPSKEFVGELRHYQQEGLNWLNFLYNYHLNGILADDMGLGKTVQVLALLSKLPKEKPTLIVMPTSLIFNWKKEIQHFLPQLDCYLHQGPLRLRDKLKLSENKIILTSYTTLRMDSILLQQLDYECVILDEAQVIKNPQTQAAQAVFGLMAGFKLCITGTPIENRLSELWSLFRFLMPDLLGTLADFEADVLAGSSDKRYLERIKRKISPFILRRSKQEVLKDLPSRIDQLVWIEMSEEQRQIYDQFLAGYKKNLLKNIEIEGMGQHRMEVLEAILRLRQICCHPLLVSNLIDENQIINSAKFDAIEQDLETLVSEGRKALVYSQFTSMLKLMAQLATKKGWKFGYLDGSTKDREQVVENFQNDPTQSLFFISLKAGGVGLNLTAADYVYLYDPWWNVAVEEQAINRAHRIGREEVVIAKRLVMLDSIEEKMIKLKSIKLQAIEQILDESESPSSLSFEDLKFLLS
jgi:superfamily II DNA or RNA helicase